MSFRDATPDDEEFFWYWRKRAEAQPWYEGKLTTREEHAVWFTDRLERITLLVWRYGQNELFGARGCVRIDSNGEFDFQAEDDLLVPMLRDLRFGVCPGERLKVTVDKSNKRAWKALKQAGFREYRVRFFCHRP